MTTFPALVPSSRTFTPGEYPATAFSGYSGAQGRVRHSNVFIAAQLRLSYIGLSEAQMLQIWNHYAARRGEFEAFTLSVEALSGSDIADYVPATYRWIYAGPGQVEDLPCGGHNVSLTLETVPLSAATVIGAQLFVAIRLTTGAANGGEYEPGISESLAFSIQAGAAFVALNGLNQTLALSLEPGATAGDVEAEGVDLFLFMDLLNGVANEGRDGIDETISLSLAAGAADSGVTTDPDFASVSLLLHMDGSDGSTTFTDSSSNAFTVTASGDAQISTKDPKFGTGALTLDGAGDYLQTPADSAFQLGTGDFTIECWVYLNSGNTNDGLFALEASSGSKIPAVLVENGEWKLSLTTGVSQFAQGLITTGAWQHLAFVRSGTDVKLFIDGTQLGATRTNSTNYTTNKLSIGYYFSSSFAINARIDEFRVTKGVARYTTNFTPPTAPFPDS